MIARVCDCSRMLAARLVRRRPKKLEESFELQVGEEDADSTMDSEQQAGKKVLVLDLDETLLHTSSSPISSFDLHFRYACSKTGKSIDVFARYRPFAKEFLRYMSECFEVVVFTASQQAVGEADEVRRPADRRTRRDRHSGVEAILLTALWSRSEQEFRQRPDRRLLGLEQGRLAGCRSF